MLLCTQYVGSRQTFELTLAAQDGMLHPTCGKPQWEIKEHLGVDDSPSVRPLAKLEVSMEGRDATVSAFGWPGTVILEVTADAPHPLHNNPNAMPRTTKFKKRVVIRINEVRELPEGLALVVMPVRHRPI